MNSSLYHCLLRHERLEPRRHKFGYGLFMLYIDLDDLPALQNVWPLSVNRPNLFSFYESDHLKALPEERKPNMPAAGESLAARIRALAGQAGLSEPVERVMLLTLPRIFNYVFNPVSFYFLFGADQRALACVAEVSNTFDEIKTYYVPAAPNKEGRVFELTAAKHFYVSPFGELADCFRFVLPVPDESLALVVNTVRQEPDGTYKNIMCANLSGKCAPLTSSALTLNLVRYPLLTLKIIALIHWHALLLFLKKVPYHAKDEALNLQLDVFNRRKEKANG